MPWVRFDDQFPIHRKVAGLSDAQYRLASEAVFWCARNLTDGRIAEDEVTQIRPRARDSDVAALVRRGIWHEAGRDCPSDLCPVPGPNGWVIHDYLEFQPSKAEVLAQREKKELGGLLGNHKRWHVRRGIKEPGCPFCKD